MFLAAEDINNLGRLKPPSLKIKTLNIITVYVLNLLFYGLTAINSVGYYHADEHYQTIEFSGFLRGTHTLDEMPWEYSNRMRSALLPTAAYGIISIANAVGVGNPFTIAATMRLLTAFFALFVVFRFARHLNRRLNFHDQYQALLPLSFLLWFMPFLAVRFSSETWGGLLFLLGLLPFISAAPNTSRKTYALTGLLFGLSMLCRFQMGFAITGWLIWFVMHRKSELNGLLSSLGALLLTLLAGALLDGWFYGEPTFALFNYVYAFFENTAPSDFDSSLWYSYIDLTLRGMGAAIALPILAAWLYLVFRKPFHVLSLTTVMFIVAHAAVGHKELRFLMPMAFLLPAILVEVVSDLATMLQKTRQRRFLRFGLGVLLAIQLPGLFAMAITPAGQGYGGTMHYLRANYLNQRVNIISPKWANPFDPWGGLPAKFYCWDGLQLTALANLCDLNADQLDSTSVNVVVIRTIDRTKAACGDPLSVFQAALEAESLSPWVHYLARHYRGFNHEHTLEVWRIRTH